MSAPRAAAQPFDSQARLEIRSDGYDAGGDGAALHPYHQAPSGRNPQALRLVFQTQSLRTRIPTGSRPKAQGCEARATLGNRSSKLSNRNAVAANWPLMRGRHRHNLVEVVFIFCFAPKVGAAHQPWAD